MNKRIKRWMTALTALALCAGLLLPGQAADVTATVHGARLSGTTLIGTTTYVPFTSFCRAIGESASETGGVGTATGSYTVRATAGQAYIVANGRYLYTGTQSPVRLVNGTLMAPVRTLARAYGAVVTWKGHSAVVTGKGKLASGSSTYNSTDLYWLSRIISAEAKGEPLVGKIAVGNVVLNRKNSALFPNTIKGVIFQVDSGVYQFTPVADGTIYDQPTGESVIAAKLVLDQASAASDALYFFNPEKTSASWIVNNRSFVVKIGNHAFYR